MAKIRQDSYVKALHDSTCFIYQANEVGFAKKNNLIFFLTSK